MRLERFLILRAFARQRLRAAARFFAAEDVAAGRRIGAGEGWAEPLDDVVLEGADESELLGWDDPLGCAGGDVDVLVGSLAGGAIVPPGSFAWSQS